MPPNGNMMLAVSWSQKSISEWPSNWISYAPTDQQQNTQSTEVTMVTIQAAFLRGRWYSSVKNAVPISCMEMVEVSAANTSRA